MNCSHTEIIYHCMATIKQVTGRYLRLETAPWIPVLVRCITIDNLPPFSIHISFCTISIGMSAE